MGETQLFSTRSMALRSGISGSIHSENQQLSTRHDLTEALNSQIPFDNTDDFCQIDYSETLLNPNC